MRICPAIRYRSLSGHMACCLPDWEFVCEAYDLPVDIICTPTQTIYTSTVLPKPKGILWEFITAEMLRDIGALHALAKLQGRSVNSC